MCGNTWAHSETLGCVGHPSSTQTTEAVTAQNSCIVETEKEHVVLTALPWLCAPLRPQKLCWQSWLGQGSLCTHAGCN